MASSHSIGVSHSTHFDFCVMVEKAQVYFIFMAGCNIYDNSVPYHINASMRNTKGTGSTQLNKAIINIINYTVLCLL